MGRRLRLIKFNRRWLVLFITINCCIYIAELILFAVNDSVIDEQFDSVLVSSEAMWNIPLYVLSIIIAGHIK